MKIVGVTYYDGCENLVLKSDSSMLVNRKPLFMPDSTCDLQALPCYVLRVSRLGRSVAPRFAARYYDAVAPGVDFFAADLLAKAKACGGAWTEAVAFEYSLAIGEFTAADKLSELNWQLWRGESRVAEAAGSPAGAEQVFADVIARVSSMVTIRQGDLIYVALKQEPWRLQPEDIIRAIGAEQEKLYCKIK